LSVGIGAGIKYLIVDDHKVFRNEVYDALLALGASAAEVEQAENGEVAYNMISSKKDGRQYDIIILDWHMPEVTGLELLKQCRAEKEYDNIAFLMLTAETDKDSIIQAMKNGAASYIQKPFVAADFNEKMTKLINFVKSKMAK
jgi:two-component system, chemotaxis family, chemotaxis protein CheY